ncbi:MAG: shikimate dehydrogenase [Muribaculaceae bacterium]|nr:shikimate dehydrogenase [Muribaculaceae bacterium]
MDRLHTQIYGLIGYPLGHSFSRDYFNKKFETEGINAEYVNFEIPTIEEFPSVVARNSNLSGLNVTIPYKEKVISMLDALDATAEAIGAVNVIKVIRNSRGQIAKLKGFNSDVIGFMDSIRDLLRPYHKKALVLGTGGASKAVSYGLRQLGVEPTCVSRTKAEGRYTYHGLSLHPEIVSEHMVIVNTTPLGMYPNVDKCPDLPYDYITPEHLCYDVLYNPDTTLFMRKCAEHGATTKNGLEMLLMQAFAAWNIWRQ